MRVVVVVLDDIDAAAKAVGVVGRNEATARMESEANCKNWRRPCVAESVQDEEEDRQVVVVAVNGRKASLRNT